MEVPPVVERGERVLVGEGPRLGVLPRVLEGGAGARREALELLESGPAERRRRRAAEGCERADSAALRPQRHHDGAPDV